jgi:hypothetical protein
LIWIAAHVDERQYGDGLFSLGGFWCWNLLGYLLRLLRLGFQDVVVNN